MFTPQHRSSPSTFAKTVPKPEGNESDKKLAQTSIPVSSSHEKSISVYPADTFMREEQQLESLRYSIFSEPSKSATEMVPDCIQIFEDEEKKLYAAAAPGSLEKDLDEDKKTLMKKIREELLLFNPEKTVVLEGLRELAENFRTELIMKEREIQTMVEEAQRLESERKVEVNAEQQEQIKGLEVTVKTASSIGKTPEEAAATVIQLTKSRASLEAAKKHITELEEKVVELQNQKKQEEQMLREKKAQIESELNEALAHFGPEKFKEITRELQETIHELKITKENLRW
ncbi:hypothetical protein GUITHDRAFT_139747 [Guillardia theta CCMP2712]|uniref:Uncharacterized protein n=1 Tax=Guillardia theta (strain CCMP2712) TaxID=905079 RepID=L1J8T1_GUITC|nr:hypothetical protein GUITHDRAFT_139747 [Guillardia theta CCMP2712]EKX44514.1 hypothetical protein GUITHDRAFT_139747 [Guillardia theta CCMP2712]|eukprot:XP_005831494.1 hypothetical protein GUITHDRAFT_139747 [Guillardia theta CCMP2712]